MRGRSVPMLLNLGVPVSQHFIVEKHGHIPKLLWNCILFQTLNFCIRRNTNWIIQNVHHEENLVLPTWMKRQFHDQRAKVAEIVWRPLHTMPSSDNNRIAWMSARWVRVVWLCSVGLRFRWNWGWIWDLQVRFGLSCFLRQVSIRVSVETLLLQVSPFNLIPEGRDRSTEPGNFGAALIIVSICAVAAVSICAHIAVQAYCVVRSVVRKRKICPWSDK